MSERLGHMFLMCVRMYRIYTRICTVAHKLWGTQAHGMSHGTSTNTVQIQRYKHQSFCGLLEFIDGLCFKSPNFLTLSNTP